MSFVAPVARVLIFFPVTEGRTAEERKEGLAKLRLITDHIMLRRMKEEHTSSMELPPKRYVESLLNLC